MTIDQAKTFYELLLNKTQVGGYTTPDEFNLLAARAQLELYIERYGNPNTLGQGTGTPRQGANISQVIKNQLKPFLVKDYSVNLTPSTHYSDGTLPTDFNDYDSCVIYGNEVGVPTEVDNDKFGGRLKSLVVPPTQEFPIFTIYGNKIRLAPNTIFNINFSYYRLPKAPVWAYTGSPPAYDQANSVQFEMPDSTHNEIVAKMLQYKGISIREQELFQYSQTKDNQGI